MVYITRSSFYLSYPLELKIVYKYLASSGGGSIKTWGIKKVKPIDSPSPKTAFPTILISPIRAKTKKWAFPKPSSENQKHRTVFFFNSQIILTSTAALYISTSRPCVCCTRHSVHCRRLHNTPGRVHTIYTHTHAHTAFNKKQRRTC